MNLGDVPEGVASAPAPAAEIAAAIAAEEAPTPQEQAVSNPVTNVLSALLTGRRLQQQQPAPQQPQAQQPAAGTSLTCCRLMTLLSGRHDALSHTRLQSYSHCKLNVSSHRSIPDSYLQVSLPNKEWTLGAGLGRTPAAMGGVMTCSSDVCQRGADDQCEQNIRVCRR